MFWGVPPSWRIIISFGPKKYARGPPMLACCNFIWGPPPPPKKNARGSPYIGQGVGQGGPIFRRFRHFEILFDPPPKFQAQGSPTPFFIVFFPTVCNNNYWLSLLFPAIFLAKIANICIQYQYLSLGLA